MVLGLLVAYQVFVNEEMLLLTALACLVAVAAYVVQRPGEAPRAGRRFPGRARGGRGGWRCCSAYPIWYQFNGPQSYRGLQAGCSTTGART